MTETLQTDVDAFRSRNRELVLQVSALREASKALEVQAARRGDLEAEVNLSLTVL